MAAEVENEKPTERPSEGVGFFTNLKMVFTDAATQLISPFSQEARLANHMNNIRDTAYPGTTMMAFLAQQEGFKEGQPNHDALNSIRNDKEFMGALDKALRSDKTIMSTMLENSGGEDGTPDPAILIQALSKPEDRKLMTQVLNVVAKDDNDGFGAKYLSEVTNAAQKGEYSKLDGLLEEGGISDQRVKMASDPSQFLNMAMKDPKAFGEQMSAMMGLEGEQAKAFSGIFEVLAQFLQMIWGNVNDPNSIAHFADKYGPSMKQAFNNVTGITDQENAEKANKADNDNPKNRVPRADNDNPEIKVEDSKRPTAAMNNAANGVTPGSKPDAAPSFGERLADAQMTAAKYGMGLG